MNFRVKLKKIKKPTNTRMKFNLDRLKDHSICETFQVMIDGKFTPLLALDEDAEVMTTTFNKMMTEAASELLGKHHWKTQPWITEEILNMCDK